MLNEDVVNILPNVFVSQTSEVANGATGTSTLNLRGLGATRTLVLIDGKRLPFGSPFSSAANVDLVPARLVERVDVVTAGASAVYGSDAVAGVVNFVTKRNFEGFELDYQYGWNENPNDNGSSNSDDNDAAPGKDHNHSDSCRACERGTYKTGRPCLLPARCQRKCCRRW